MKLFISYIVTIASIFILSGCNKEFSTETAFADGEGGLNLQLPTFEDQTRIPIIYTKADTTLDVEVEPSAFVVKFEGKKSKEFVSYAAMRDSGVPLLLPVGSYTVTAHSSGVIEDVSDKPYFEGVETFEIVEKKTTNLTIECMFKSLGVELQLSDRFKKLLEENPYSYSYSVVVSNAKTTWTFDKENMKPCYFKDACERLVVKVIVIMNGLTFPERTWYFTGNGKDNGSAPALREYYVITLDAGKSDVKMTSYQMNEEEVQI